MPTSSGTDRIVALCFAAIATGVYLCSLASCIRWLVYADEGWKIRKHIHKGLLMATLAIFVASSIHTSLAVSTTYFKVRDLERGTVVKSVTVPWTAVVMCTVTNMAVLTVDGFLIFRCWRVCERSYKMVLAPIILWIGGAACTVLQIYWQIVQSANIPKTWTPINMTIGPGTILTPFWGCSIAVNLYSTGVILHRIWRHVQEQKKFSTAMSSSIRDLRFIMRIVVESGALYLLITIPHFIVWWTPSSTAILILAWTNLPAVGCTFNLIVIRTSQRRVDRVKDLEKSGEFISAIMDFRPTNFTSSGNMHATDHFSSGRTSSTYECDQ